ncbi:membrane hypothetical protein [Desulfovibrionales bacterium]
MTSGSRKLWLGFSLAIAWFMVLLWPLLGILPDGSLSFGRTLVVWTKCILVACCCLVLYQLSQIGCFDSLSRALRAALAIMQQAGRHVPVWVYTLAGAVLAIAYPLITNRYAQDVAVNCMTYIENYFLR